MIKINEIFYSIQGESSYAGFPTTFIRTTACNLRCSYCDTKYSYYEGQSMTEDQIIEAVKNNGAKHVCITGGEPLLQKSVYDLIKKLCDFSYLVSVETGGSLSCANVDLRAKLVIDVKTPDSGAANSFNFKNLELAHKDIEFKFVICSENDFEWSENFIRQYDFLQNFSIFYSPSHQIIDAKWLAERILQKKSTARLHLQLHKYIWSADTRGV